MAQADLKLPIWNSCHVFFFFFQTVSHYGLEYVLSFQQSIFNFICLSLSGCGFVYMSAVATEARRGLDPLELKL